MNDDALFFEREVKKDAEKRGDTSIATALQELRVVLNVTDKKARRRNE
jgi:hypothetical protein